MSKKKALAALRRGKSKTYTFPGGKNEEDVIIEMRELSYGKMQELLKEQEEEDEDGEEFGAMLLLECLYHEEEHLFDDIEEVRAELDNMGMGTFKVFMEDAIDLHGLKKEGNEQKAPKRQKKRTRRLSKQRK